MRRNSGYGFSIFAEYILSRRVYIRTVQKKSARMKGYSTALLCSCSCSKKYKYICLPYSNVCAVCAHLCKPPCVVGRKCCIVFSVSRHQCQNFPHRVCCKYHRLAMMAGTCKHKFISDLGKKNIQNMHPT